MHDNSLTYPQGLNEALRTLFGLQQLDYSPVRVQIGDMADAQFPFMSAAKWPAAITEHLINYIYVCFDKDGYQLRASRRPWPGGLKQ
jgi:hypothetical protein